MAGKSADGAREGWEALPFIPKENSHAKTLVAAIGYISGDVKVNLGIYTDNDGTVGTLLSNGEASTTNIPIFPSCCDLTEVRPTGSGSRFDGKNALLARCQYGRYSRTEL